MLQAKPGSPVRKTALTVEQLAKALGAELVLSGLAPTQPEGLNAAERAQLELAYAVHRLRTISQVARPARADGVSLVFVEDAATLAEGLKSGAGAILLPSVLRPQLPLERQSSDPALLLVAQPRLQFARAARLLQATEPVRSVHSTAVLGPGITVGLRVAIGPYVVIETGAVIGAGTEIGAGSVIGAGAVVGSECRIYPRVVLYPGTRLGDRVVVHAGAVLGSDGFGYVRDEVTGAYLQFPQQGTLVIEDDVEIGANTTIDRGALEETRIGRGAKIDNLVHVGHNVQVGADAILAAQVGISGSSSIGAGAVLAGQVGIGDHAAVGDGVILGGQGGVLPHKTLLGAGQLFWGTPAKPVKQHLRELASVTRLARRNPDGGQ